MHSTPPAAKRLKHDGSLSSYRRTTGGQAIVGGGEGSSAPTQFPGGYQDEDTSLGDSLDMLTAREISIARFMRHHEWMEEVLGTPAALYSGEHRIEESNLGINSKNEKDLQYKEAINAYESFLTPTEKNDGTTTTPASVYQSLESDLKSRLAKVQQQVDHLSSRDTRDEIFSLRTGTKSSIIKQAIQKCRLEQHKLAAANAHLPHQHHAHQSNHHHLHHPASPATPRESGAVPNINILTPTDEAQKEVESLEKEVQEALHLKIVPRNKVTRVPINFSTD